MGMLPHRLITHHVLELQTIQELRGPRRVLPVRGKTYNSGSGIFGMGEPLLLVLNMPLKGVQNLLWVRQKPYPCPSIAHLSQWTRVSSSCQKDTSLEHGNKLEKNCPG